MTQGTKAGARGRAGRRAWMAMRLVLPIIVLATFLTGVCPAPAAKYEGRPGTFSSVGGVPASASAWSAVSLGQVCPGESQAGSWLLASGILTALRVPAAMSLTADFPAQAPEGIDLLVGLDVRASTVVDAVRLHWRAGGRETYNVTPMTARGGSASAATIPGAEVALRGIEFYFEAVTGGRSVFSPGASPQENPWRVPVTVTESTGEGNLGTTPVTYRMLSFPAIFAENSVRAVLEDDLGAPDRSTWRLGRWDPAAGKYQEHGVDGVDAWAPGRAYWLVTDQAHTLDFSGQTVFPSSGGSYALTLSPGWNQVGNPFPFSVDVSAVRIRSGSVTHTLTEAATAGLIESQPLHAYTGSGYTTGEQHMAPWTGYFVANLGSQAIELLVPHRESSGEPGPAVGPLSAGRAGEAAATAPVNPADWFIRLVAVWEGGSRAVEIGARSSASEGWDPLDQLAPPPPLERDGELYTRNHRLSPALSALQRDIRPVRDPGECWEIELGGDPSGTTTLRGDAISGLPPGYRARLVDTGTGTWMNLGAESFSMAVGAPRHYRLFVGLSGWLETQTGGSSDAGGFTFALEGRNPFDKSTGVSLSLPRSTSTSLMVCDLGGRVVRQLVAGELPSGRYVIPWDGRDETGARAATGVYFFRLAAGDRRSAVRCVMVR